MNQTAMMDTYSGMVNQPESRTRTYHEEGDVEHGPQPAIGPLEKNQLQNGQAEDQNGDQCHKESIHCS